MPRLRRFGSTKTETDLREKYWATSQHGVAELGRETALFHKLAPGELGQERRRQRAVSPRLHLGRQRAEAGVRSRFHRAETGSTASHAVWIIQARPESHRGEQVNTGSAAVGAMTTPVKSASPRQGKIKVRSERVWVLKLISSIFFTFVVATTFAADGE